MCNDNKIDNTGLVCTLTPPSPGPLLWKERPPLQQQNRGVLRGVRSMMRTRGPTRLTCARLAVERRSVAGGGGAEPLLRGQP